MWPSLSPHLLRAVHRERLGTPPYRLPDEAGPATTDQTGAQTAQVIELAFGARCDAEEQVGA